VFRPACNIERQLIQRVRNGEHEVFYDLIQPYERRVWGAAFAILHNEADAEDAAQDTVFKALKHIRQFRAEARFSTWLIQIAVNEARMRRRKKHAHVVEPILFGEGGEDNYMPRDFADWREIPSEALERKEVREKLVEALDSLEQIYREVFVLRDMQQLSIAETSRALGISTTSVKTRLLRARLCFVISLHVATFGTPHDITLEELGIEMSYPVDENGAFVSPGKNRAGEKR